MLDAAPPCKKRLPVTLTARSRGDVAKPFLVNPVLTVNTAPIVGRPPPSLTRVAICPPYHSQFTRL